MEKSSFIEIIDEYLLPMFPGTSISKDEPIELPKKNRAQLVTHVGGGESLKIMPNGESEYCIQINRSNYFSAEEKSVIKNFVIKCDRLYKDSTETYKTDTADSVMRQVVASSISEDNDTFIHKILTKLGEWSQQTYEGQNISFSIGITKNEQEAGISFDDICKEDFFKVLSNGYDTILVFDKNQKLFNHEYLNYEDALIKNTYAPISFAKIANWSTDGNIGITLTRNGEILVFKEKELIFAKRRGAWKYFAHSSFKTIITKSGIAKKSFPGLKDQVYFSILDVAFARTGGCIGIVSASKIDECRSLLNEQDLFDNDAHNNKTKALKTLVKDSKFSELSRKLRLELISVDGATVLTNQGVLMSAGAILKVSAGSDGGGRQAASKALAKNGIGIKISNDGYVKIFDKEQNLIMEIG